MSHVLTVKIPHPLLDQLKTLAARRGKPRGALVREAIRKMIDQDSSEKEDWREEFQAATKAMMQGKKPKSKVSDADWDRLRKKAALGAPPNMTPEEEVMSHRRRYF